MAGLAAVPQELLPHMDWNAEDKLAAWMYFQQRLKLYYMMAGTPKEARVDVMLFFGAKEADERWTTLKDQLEKEDQEDIEKVFKVFANSFEKSSSHWQARDEYLSDYKQGKYQTTAELDIYIKDLIRRCQFKTPEV